MPDPLFENCNLKLVNIRSQCEVLYFNSSGCHQLAFSQPPGRTFAEVTYHCYRCRRNELKLDQEQVHFTELLIENVG